MRQHLLQLYEDEAFMIDRVVSFLRQGAEDGDPVVVIATPEHCEAIRQGLGEWTSTLELYDAATVLDAITRDGRVEADLFEQHVRALFASRAAQGSGRVRGFGEMVALLWEAGDHEGAVRLERLWAGLAGAERYSLLCAYPLSSTHPHHHPFLSIREGGPDTLPHDPGRSTDLQGRVDVLERETTALRGELSRRLDVQHILSEAGDNKDDFIAILSHELRNPLTPIVTAVEMLKHPRPVDEQQRLLATIGRQTGVLSRLVEDLVEARKLAAGAITVRRDPLLLSQVIHQAAEAVAPQLQARAQTFDVLCTQGDTPFSGDEVRLVQALTNLLGNASKFTPPGGRITLAGRATDGRVHIEVRDDGRGMDGEFLERAFHPYVQATVGEGGLGLGLSIVRRIVQMHGGTVEATSPGLGQGTVVRIALPAAGAAAVAAVPADPSVRVLVVDDNDDVRTTLADLMRAYGHDARRAASGQEALAAMDHRPHIVVLDLGMPGMDGFEVARRIRQSGQRPVLVALSGHVAPDAALAAGFDHQFTKPPDVDRLLRVVGLAGRRLETTPPA